MLLFFVRFRVTTALQAFDGDSTIGEPYDIPSYLIVTVYETPSVGFLTPSVNCAGPFDKAAGSVPGVLLSLI